MTNIRDEIKILLYKENLTLIDLAKMLSEKRKYKVSANSLSQKLLRDTIKYAEVKEILDCLDYDLEFKKRNGTS